MYTRYEYHQQDGKSSSDTFSIMEGIPAMIFIPGISSFIAAPCCNGHHSYGKILHSLHRGNLLFATLLNL